MLTGGPGLLSKPVTCVQLSEVKQTEMEEVRSAEPQRRRGREEHIQDSGIREEMRDREGESTQSGICKETIDRLRERERQREREKEQRAEPEESGQIQTRER